MLLVLLVLLTGTTRFVAWALLVLFVVAPIPLATWLQIRAGRLDQVRFRTRSVVIGAYMVGWVAIMVGVLVLRASGDFTTHDWEGFDRSTNPADGRWSLTVAGLIVLIAAASAWLSIALARRYQRRASAALEPPDDAAVDQFRHGNGD